MASSNGPTSFGATIVPTIRTQSSMDLTLPAAIYNSPSLTPASSREDFSPEFSERRIPPHSPFYQHPCDSSERAHSRSTSKVDGFTSSEKDLEAGPRAPLAPDSENPFRGKVSVDCNKECRMWPSKQTIMEERKAEAKKKRDQKMCGGCGPVVELWGRSTKRQKLIFKICLALFLLGVVTAIAVGITVAVNGSVYVSEGQAKQIPAPGDGN